MCLRHGITYIKKFIIGKNLLTFVFTFLVIIVLISNASISLAYNFVISKSEELSNTNAIVVGFDVYDDLIAVGVDDNRILFYDEKGNFLYEWNFYIEAYYSFFFDSEGCLILMLSRSGNIYTIDQEGTIINTLIDGVSGTDYMHAEKNGRHSKTIAGQQIESDKYSVQLTDSDGSKIVIYQTDSTKILYRRITYYVLLPTALILWLVGFIIQEKAKKKKSV